MPATPARAATWLLLIAGSLGLLQTSYLEAKASVAQVLIAHSWQDLQSSARQQGSGKHKPWWWADFSPIARLRWQQHDVYVMSSTSGQALAFGPGHLPQSAQPGASGSVIIAGHNDSHFAFVEQLGIDDTLTLESALGTQKTYKIDSIEIVDSREASLQHSDNDELVLVTCYPFNSLSSNPTMRLVIIASVLNAGKHSGDKQRMQI